MKATAYLVSIMATSQPPALRKAAKPATKRATATSKPAEAEPLEDLSHLTPMRQMIEAFKDVPAHKIKVWPVAKGNGKAATTPAPKASKPSPAPKSASRKPAKAKEEEPWPDFSHLSGIEQLMEIGKRLTPKQLREIKDWPLLK